MLAAHRRDRLQLIEEDHGRRHLAGDAEHLPHAFLGFAQPLGEDFRPVDRDEVDAAFVGQALASSVLPVPGGP